jgi:hypothetical protein
MGLAEQDSPRWMPWREPAQYVVDDRQAPVHHGGILDWHSVLQTELDSLLELASLSMKSIRHA